MNILAHDHKTKIFLQYYYNSIILFSKQSDSYRLRIENYTGTAGQALIGYNKAKDFRFTTMDSHPPDLEFREYGDFGDIYGNSGWWYTGEMAGNLNGKNYASGKTRFGQDPKDGIFWYPFGDDNRALKTVTMSILPRRNDLVTKQISRIDHPFVV